MDVERTKASVTAVEVTLKYGVPDCGHSPVTALGQEAAVSAFR